jgi:hypothetical protein
MAETTQMKSAKGTQRIGRVGTAYNLIIRLHDASKVWGRQVANLCRGDRVRFTATVEASTLNCRGCRVSSARRNCMTVRPEL